MSVEPTIIHDVPARPTRPDDSHKGTFGTVIVIGGCATMPGAPALSARAALRSGAGLVKIASDQTTLATALCITPSATGICQTGSTAHDWEAIQNADPQQRAVLAVGPGWGTQASHAALLKALLDGPRPIVLDADGLNVLAALCCKDWFDARRLAERNAALVLTPHPGEFLRLADSAPQDAPVHASPTNPSERPAAAAALAQLFGATVVLKGQQTVVSPREGGRVYRNATGNPALATAGTGDVLTGVLASLMAQGMPAFEAACLATFLHGAAADQWAKTHGQAGLLASDLCDALPKVLTFPPT
ncbi:MAG: NAD(P)H-hydrate dehydratase [Planctomycetota bacterium]